MEQASRIHSGARKRGVAIGTGPPIQDVDRMTRHNSIS